MRFNKLLLFVFSFILVITLISLAEGLKEVSKIPDLSGSNESPSISANLDGDIMIIYRNSQRGVVYYYKDHSSGKWEGPKEIPNQNYPKSDYANIWWTDVEPTTDGVFHAFWSLRIHGGYYATFNPKTKKWSNPQKVVLGYVESPMLVVNPVTDDVVITWINRNGTAKNVIYRVKKKGSKNFSEPVNISKFKYSATNEFATFDEDGVLYISYKQDKLNEADDIMDKVAVINPDNDYKVDWVNELTWEYGGWHMLPAVGVVKKKGLLTFAWFQKKKYFYQPFEVVYNEKTKKYEVKFDNSNLDNQIFAQAPQRPNFEYHSKVLRRGTEELLVIYKDTGFAIKMIKYKDGEWINMDDPIDLCEEQPSAYTFDTYYAPNIGILSAWFTREDEASVYYSIYDYPFITIKSAVNVKVEKKVERSFFYEKYINYVTWENNPYNEKYKVNVVKYNLYRKLKTESISEYKKIAELDKDTLYYEDTDNSITSDYKYDYYVTCVDSEGRESKIE